MEEGHHNTGVAVAECVVEWRHGMHVGQTHGVHHYLAPFEQCADKLNAVGFLGSVVQQRLPGVVSHVHICASVQQDPPRKVLGRTKVFLRHQNLQ